MENLSEEYLELLRKFVINSHLDLYQRIAHYAYENPDKEELQKVLTIMHRQLEQLGIRMVSSPPASPFDPEKMDVSLYASVPTDNPEMDGIVAFSLVPRFIWTLPLPGFQDGGQGLTLLKEEVILYEYPITSVEE